MVKEKIAAARKALNELYQGTPPNILRREFEHCWGEPFDLPEEETFVKWVKPIRGQGKSVLAPLLKAPPGPYFCALHSVAHDDKDCSKCINAYKDTHYTLSIIYDKPLTGTRINTVIYDDIQPLPLPPGVTRHPPLPSAACFMKGR